MVINDVIIFVKELHDISVTMIQNGPADKNHHMSSSLKKNEIISVIPTFFQYPNPLKEV